MKRWWISWYTREDRLPEAFPDAAPWLGVWMTGLTHHEPAHASIVAWVSAETEPEAKALVLSRFTVDSPFVDGDGWRFCKEQPKPPNSERFPRPSWAPADAWGGTGQS